jgi:hypothetical protein
MPEIALVAELPSTSESESLCARASASDGDADVDALTLHDLRPEDRRQLELLEEILARLPAPESERRAELLAAIGAVVRGDTFTVASIYAFAEKSGAAGEPLRKALTGLSPKACGRLLARWAVGPTIVRESESRGDGVLWRVVGDFETVKSAVAERAKLGEW